MLSRMLVLLLLCTAGGAMELRRLRARVMYDGTRYRGFQTQSIDVPTVQTAITAAISKRFGMHISTTGASRTDIGVHARGNCIHFDVPAIEPEGLQKLQFRVNQLLPDDIRIYNASFPDLANTEEARRKFHATASALGKRYCYRFFMGEVLDPMRMRYTAHFYRPFDLSLFEHSLQQCVGTHDFVSFGNSIEKTKGQYEDYGIALNTTRTVQSITMKDEGSGYYRIDLHVESALNRMLRNIVGTSMRIAQGRMSLEQLQALLKDAPGRRCNPASPAPPQGLTLEHVFYEDY